MKRTYQKRQTLRGFRRESFPLVGSRSRRKSHIRALRIAMAMIATSVVLAIAFPVISLAIPRPQVNVEPASVFVDFSSIQLSVSMLNGGYSFISDGEVTRTTTNFFNAVPPSVMTQVPNRDLYYQADYITITQYSAVGIASGEVYADSVYISFDVPLVLNDGEYVQFWIRIAEIGFYTLNGILIDQSDYVSGAMYSAVYFYEDITSETSTNGNQWQCLQYGPSSGTTSLQGITLFVNGNAALPNDTYQVVCNLEFGAVAFGSAIVGDNGDSTDDYYHYLDIQQILLQQGVNLGNQLLDFMTGQGDFESPYNGVEIPEYNLDQILKEDEALDQADDDLDEFLDDVSSPEVRNSVDFFQYLFRKINEFSEVAVLTGGTIVVSIFRAVMGR